MYGILVVEDEGLYQIIGEAASRAEAEELAIEYEWTADPENPSTFCPPSEFVIWRRDPSGAYAVREPLALGETNTARLDHIEKLCRAIPLNSALLSAIQEVRDRLNGKE